MRSFKVCAYVRNGKKQAAADFDIEATNWHTAAYRGTKEATVFARAAGIGRPKMIELRITAVKKEAQGEE